MNKILLYCSIAMLWAQPAAAQERLPENTLSVTAGPNLFLLSPGKVSGNSEYLPGPGATLGVDFTNNFSRMWHYKLGLRYNFWTSTLRSGDLTWPSEYTTGHYVYDPALPHALESKHTDLAYEVLMSIGWHSKPARWRWVTDAEIGVTGFTKETVGGKNVVRLCTGFSMGPEWVFSPQYQWFMQAGGRTNFNKIRKSGYEAYRFVSLQLETGIRYAF